MFLYNIHTPSKTFALSHKDGEEYGKFVERIISKAGLSRDEAGGVREGKDGAGLVYEFDGGRWSLEDEDDLQILLARLPPASTPSATLHLTTPHAHAHFASPPPPSYTTSKSKSKKPSSKPAATAAPTSILSTSKSDSKPSASENFTLAPPAAPVKSSKTSTSKANGDKVSPALAPPSSGEKKEVVADTKSVKSSKSRKSKYGDEDAEPLGEVNKRAWHEFHNNNGVRTVTGKVGNVENVRMLLKPGYKGVYISRTFALKNKLVPAKYAMGSSGYTGLKTIGEIPITVGSKTASHPAFVNEEMHFDVVLGRSWVERMNIKIDPLDQTILTYMESGESIPCDIVVLKDSEGNKIIVT